MGGGGSEFQLRGGTRSGVRVLRFHGSVLFRLSRLGCPMTSHKLLPVNVDPGGGEGQRPWLLQKVEGQTGWY